MLEIQLFERIRVCTPVHIKGPKSVMFGAGLVKKMEPTGVSSGPVSLQQIGVFIRKVLQNNFFIPPCEVYKFISTSTNLNIVLHPYF